MNNFSIALWHTMKSGFYTATSDDQLTKSSKTFLKAKFAPQKKRCGHCLVVCCQFDPPHLSESQQNHYIWEVSSTNWWGYAWKLQYLQPVLVNRKGPILFHDNTNCTSHNQCFKGWTNWATKFCLTAMFTWPLANGLSLLQASQLNSAGKMHPQPAGGRKCFPSVHWIPKYGFLCYQINKLISHWQNYIDLQWFLFWLI